MTKIEHQKYEVIYQENKITHQKINQKIGFGMIEINRQAKSEMRIDENNIETQSAPPTSRRSSTRASGECATIWRTHREKLWCACCASGTRWRKRWERRSRSLREKGEAEGAGKAGSKG